MPRFIYAKCRYAECRYAECRYAERRYAACHYAECRVPFLPQRDSASQHYTQHKNKTSTAYTALNMLNNVTYIVLSVVQLNAVMVSVVAPYFTFKVGTFRLKKDGHDHYNYTCCL